MDFNSILSEMSRDKAFKISESDFGPLNFIEGFQKIFIKSKKYIQEKIISRERRFSIFVSKITVSDRKNQSFRNFSKIGLEK